MREKQLSVSDTEEKILTAALKVINRETISGTRIHLIAKEADVTILCVREWLDSRSALSSMIDELHLAKANIIGVVYLATK